MTVPVHKNVKKKPCVDCKLEKHFFSLLYWRRKNSSNFDEWYWESHTASLIIALNKTLLLSFNGCGSAFTREENVKMNFGIYFCLKKSLMPHIEGEKSSNKVEKKTKWKRHCLFKDCLKHYIIIVYQLLWLL